VSEAKKLLSLPMAIALVVGNMIGSGIFLLPATMASYGGVSVLGWLFSTTGALLLALTFAWLARTRTVGSGIYAYAQLVFGDLAGFLMAWCYWLSTWITVAALAVATVSYLSALVPVLAQSPVLAAGVALLFVWILTAVNVHGVRSGGSVQVVTVVLKLLPLLLLMLFGLGHLEPANFTPFNPTGDSLPQATAGAATLALFALLGFESASVGAGKVRNPERNVARATLWGTVLAAFVTAAVCIAAIAIVPPTVLAKSNAPLADVAQVLWGTTGATLIALVGAISAFGCLNGWILLGGALTQSMAHDGLWSRAAARENARGSPAAALLFGGVVATLMIVMNYNQALIKLFTFLTLLVTIANLVPYLFAAMAALLLMKGRGAAVPLTPVRAAVLLVASAYSLWAIYGAGHEAVSWGFLLLLSGLPVYVWLRRDGKTSPGR
jgi:APA family basic amino acid/polyamine antiporter